jgi:hypothetical protein
MAKVLVYVDPLLTRQVASGVIGSEVSLTQKDSRTAGINFKVLLSRSSGEERSTTTKVSELLPEVVAEAVYEAVDSRIDSLENARERLIAGSANAFKPGSPVIVGNASLSAEGHLASSQLSGEACALYRLKIGEFFVHCYFPVDAKATCDSLVTQPIEILGLLRYTPSYSVPGAMSLNLGLRVCAVWLR